MRLLLLVACLAGILTAVDAFYAYLPLFETSNNKNGDDGKKSLGKRVASLENIQKRTSESAAGRLTQENQKVRLML